MDINERIKTHSDDIDLTFRLLRCGLISPDLAIKFIKNTNNRRNVLSARAKINGSIKKLGAAISKMMISFDETAKALEKLGKSLKQSNIKHEK